MKSEASLNAAETLVRSGVNYVCGGCGTLLYHNGPDGASEAGEPGFASRQPWEVVDKLKTCPGCGRTLISNPDPDTIKILRIDEAGNVSTTQQETQAPAQRP